MPNAFVLPTPPAVTEKIEDYRRRREFEKQHQIQGEAPIRLDKMTAAERQLWFARGVEAENRRIAAIAEQRRLAKLRGDKNES